MKIVRRDPTMSPFKAATLGYFALVAIFVLLIFTLPGSKTTMAYYHLAPASYHILYFLLTLPSMMVWAAAFYGYSKLQTYGQSINGTVEGDDFRLLGRGLAWLAWSLPVTALTSVVLNAVAAASPGFHPAAIIIANYVALLLPLIGFSIVSRGARGLTEHAKTRFSWTSAQWIILGFVAAGVLYCYLTFRHFNLSSLSSTNNPYHLPVWLMVLTVVIPYLYAWFVGLLATYEIGSFSQQIRGLLYRQALRLLSGGLVSVIISSIAIQYLLSASPRHGFVVVDGRLLWINIVRIIGGIGYIMIAFGVSRLKRIEDI
jgi:hypothetical protein